MDVLKQIQEEPVIILQEVKIQSVIDEKKEKQWIFDHIKNLPPLHTTQEQRMKAQERINSIKKLNTNNKTIQYDSIL